jgi:thiosulfate/3-mercaptopyruvate sulfurtransferase
MVDRSKWFASTDWLADHLDDPDVIVVDGSWHLPTGGRDAQKEYREAHIPGAVFFDIDAIADRSNPLPHMLPTEEVFAEAVGALGIDESRKIVVYDSLGLSSAPRVWWTFKIMGAKDVVILEGGLPKWLAEGRPVLGGIVNKPSRRFNAKLDTTSVRNLNEVRDGVASGALQLVDARPLARFLGEAPEPRSWVKSGRIPGSINLPSTDIVIDGILQAPETIRNAFETAGVDLDGPIVTSCGSGVNAAVLTLALETIGVEVDRSAIYDGSWTEWGGRDDTEIVTGPVTGSSR